MTKRTAKSWNLYRGMSIYKRTDSPLFYGRLYIEGKYYRKCLGTEDKKDAERLVFQWKNELLTSDDSPVVSVSYALSKYAKQLVEKQKGYKVPPSKVLTWKKTQQLLNREKGILDFFGDKDVRSITKSDIDKFIQQLPLTQEPLTRSTIYKHTNTLKQILELADIEISFPTIRGAKKQTRRGWFNLKDYKKLLKHAKEYSGREFHISGRKKITITEDLNSFIIFMVGSMLRPTESEVYSLKFKDIQVNEEQGVNYLSFFVNRKNRPQEVDTLETSYFAYRDICKRRKDYQPDDYLFLPEYENRRTATEMMTKQFGLFLKDIKMTRDRNGDKLSTYSLRHTAITFNLQKNAHNTWDIMRRADTSKDMIEDFYYPNAKDEDNLESFLRIKPKF